MRAHQIRQFRCRGGFTPQIKFPHRPALEIGDDHARAQTAGLAAQSFKVGSGPFIGINVARHLFTHTGAQDLDCNLAAFGGDSAVDLRDGCSANGFGIELRVQ